MHIVAQGLITIWSEYYRKMHKAKCSFTGVYNHLCKLVPSASLELYVAKYFQCINVFDMWSTPFY